MLSIASVAVAQDGLKIYISADMEGVVGAVTGEQLGPGGFEYERFRGFMTAEVNAAIDAARAAGATEFLISDSHGNGQNILIEKLPDDVMIVRQREHYQPAAEWHDDDRGQHECGYSRALRCSGYYGFRRRCSRGGKSGHNR